ncbi:hypothetical protein [Tellurirhabdus rosea]|uniref:hypothetical protein n=1 Tax=Tellurirhabdus rosea TaxID=2674997 RepID=UPI002B1CB69C|nr:hypothetical protein [Tellurirhabdus rosea]
MVTEKLLELPVHLQTIAEFEQWERQHVTEGSYEFVRGRVIPKNGIKQEEILIARFLLRAFAGTDAYRQGHELMPETDSYVDLFRKRIPALTYFTPD